MEIAELRETAGLQPAPLVGQSGSSPAAGSGGTASLVCQERGDSAPLGF